MKKIFNTKGELNLFIYEQSKKIFLCIKCFEYTIEFNKSIISLDCFLNNKISNIPIYQNNLNSSNVVNIRFTNEGNYELHFMTKEKQCEIVYFRVYNDFKILKGFYERSKQARKKLEIAMCACEIVYQLEQLSYHFCKNHKNGENFAFFLNEKCKQIIWHCKITDLMLKYPMKRINMGKIDLLKYSLLENLEFINNSAAHHKLYSSLSEIIEKIPEENYRFK
jgi:hypothetical protein